MLMYRFKIPIYTTKVLSDIEKILRCRINNPS